MIFVTAGDPYSINLEILSKVLIADPELVMDHAVVLLGVKSVVVQQSLSMKLGLPIVEWESAELPKRPGLYLYDTSQWIPGDSKFIRESPANRMSVKMRGAVAISALYGFENLYQTNKSLQNGSEPFCVVTLPIDKYACSRAGFSFTGHTEYFGALWDGDPLMTLAYRDVRVALATTHVPLAQVTKELTKEKLVEKLKSMQSALIRQLGIQRPQILVCGINPHSGDRGAIGTEELETLCPALDVMRAEDKADFIGPVSGDTAFYMYHKLGCDGMLAMYHDQGLAPLKAVYFDSAINMTLGLKHFRMSPDHGPAQDIFGEDAASESSLEECFRTASIFLSHHIPENKKQKSKRPIESPGLIAGSTGLASGLQEGMRGKVIPFRIPKKSAGIPTKDA